MVSISTQQAIDTALRHHRAGQLPQAESIYRQILVGEPNHADALHLLGVIFHQTGRTEAAVDLIQRAIGVNPSKPDYYSNLGYALSDLGRLDESIQACAKALELDPDHAMAKNNLASAHRNLGNAFKSAGRLDEAIAEFLAAIQVDPDDVTANSNLSDCLISQQRYDEAIPYCRRTIELRPQLPEAHVNLGNAYAGQGRLNESAAAYRKSIELRPAYAEAHSNLGNVLKAAGQMDESVEAYYRAVQARPEHPAVRSNYLYALLFHSSDPRWIMEQHREWDRVHGEPVSRGSRPFANDRSPDRKLRVGYVSSDFYLHPVGRGLLPLLGSHDKENFEVFCYSDVLLPDKTTERLKSRSDQWRPILGLNDEQLAQQVEADRIDILVDLTLHMAHNRLGAFARKPAPLQMTYAGYPATTGLSAIDYRITDAYLDPPGESEAHNSEKLLRLKSSFWCYPTDEREPAVNGLPARTNGYVTLGSLNNPCKNSLAAIDLWAKVLHAIPASRLMLLVAEREDHSPYFVEQFKQRGIAEDRLLMRAKRARSDYLELYNRIDIGIDPLPYHGHMTSCDAFWMGVPVVSLRGRTSVGKGGMSLLSNLGLHELIAETEDQVIGIVQRLAGDLDKLAELRSGLRQRMMASPLCDARSYVRDIEQMYRDAWRARCGQQR